MAVQLSDPKKLWQPRDELNIVLVGRRKIVELNKQFLGHDGPTDVITFDYTNESGFDSHGDTRLVGEIFVCIDIAVEAAIRHRNSMSGEVVLYVIHGILHLSGFDDRTEHEIQLMREAEKSMISRLKQEFDLDIFFVS